MLARLSYFGHVAKRFRRRNLDDWEISDFRIFGKGLEDMCPHTMYDFEMAHYVYFLDNVPSLENLIKGLEMLDPFVDDALCVANTMTDVGFASFKLALVQERKAARMEISGGQMPKEYSSILLPTRFLDALLLVPEAARVPLGLVLIRIMEDEIVSV